MKVELFTRLGALIGFFPSEPHMPNANGWRTASIFIGIYDPRVWVWGRIRPEDSVGGLIDEYGFGPLFLICRYS